MAELEEIEVIPYRPNQRLMLAGVIILLANVVITLAVLVPHLEIAMKTNVNVPNTMYEIVGIMLTLDIIAFVGCIWRSVKNA